MNKIILGTVLLLGTTLAMANDGCHVYDNNDRAYLQMLNQQKRVVEVRQFERLKRAQLNQCNGAKLNIEEMMSLHKQNDNEGAFNSNYFHVAYRY